jgi:3-isopropylmalate/(R)-2-methylmalate dehydratase large subunit
VLRGKQIAKGVRLLVAPASKQDQDLAAKDGTLQALQDAGCELLPNSCGACAGYGSRFNKDEVVISTTARNFKGRMGPASTQVYLASPYTVAASALTGYITDPREVLA